MPLNKRFAVGSAQLGKGNILFQGRSNGSGVVIIGSNGKGLLLNRDGQTVYQFSSPNVAHVGWDSTDEVFATLAELSTSIALCNVVARKTTTIDLGMKDLCFMQWSLAGPELAVGSVKGGLILFNRETSKKIPVHGVHTKRIVAGRWTRDNLLVTVGEDSLLSVSSCDGALHCQANLSRLPLSLTVAEPSQLQPPAQPHVYAVVNHGRELAVFNVTTKDALDEVKFDDQLGTATCVACCNRTNFTAIVGFESGAVVVYALSRQTWGKVLCLVKPFSSSVKDLVWSETNSRCGLIGDHSLLIYDVRDDKLVEPAAERTELPVPSGKTGKIAWDREGTVLSVSSLTGDYLCYTTRAPMLACPAVNGVLYLSGTRELVMASFASGEAVLRVTVPVDPEVLACGGNRIAVGAGKEVYFYSFLPRLTDRGAQAGEERSPQHQSMSGMTPTAGDVGDESPHSPTKLMAARQNTDDETTLLEKVEYAAPVMSVKVNSGFAALLVDGKVVVHAVGGTTMPAEQFTFPAEPDVTVISISLSEQFLAYATDQKLCIVVLDGMQHVLNYTVPKGVKYAFPSPIATRIAVVDSENALHIFNPITETATLVEGCEPSTTGVMWDQGDLTVLISYNRKMITTFSYVASTRHGPTCESVLLQGSTTENLHTPLPTGFVPVCLQNGVLACQTPAGGIAYVPLLSHQDVHATAPSAQGFYNCFSLNHLRLAVQHMTTQKQATDLCVRALHLLDVELAARVYCQMSEPGVVLCLEKIKHIHEKNLLIGHISMILGFFKDAEGAFLRSSQPICALEMRRDLMQWEHALALAKNLAPEQLPHISKDFAQQLEYRGEYVKALQMYTAGNIQPAAGASMLAQRRAEAQNELCDAGAARCLIRTGSVKEGVKSAIAAKNPALLTECAKILEGMRHFDDAAHLYESSGNAEKAATLYIVECRNLKAAGRLLPKIKSRNILVMYAKGKEEEKAYEEAEEAYRLAEDWDNVVRIKAEYLNDLHGANIIVRKTRSAEAAALVARMCHKKGEHGAAIEFLVLAKQIPQAFQVAKETNSMGSFESALLGQVQLKDGVAPVESQPDFTLIAEHYESISKAGLAGQYYHIAGNFNLALKKYLEAGQPEDIEKAVQVVGMARSDALTNRLIDYLIGESDGEPKDTSYIFKLYMALGSYEKAAKTSVLIATKEQEVGNYRVAHSTLVEACRMLQERNMRIPSDLRRSLMLLHSYIIVKHLIKPMDDNETATRMLLRVVRNIHKFPQHIPTILTSAVLQSLKADFRQSAFDNARLIIQNEKYRTDLNEKQRKKIEGVVRRRGKEDMTDPVEAKTPCLVCSAPVPETELDCGACKNTLPFCIVTGKHLVKGDFTLCPHCRFPALYSAFLKLLVEVPTCPMCNVGVDPNVLVKVDEPDLSMYI